MTKALSSRYGRHGQPAGVPPAGCSQKEIMVDFELSSEFHRR
jgi:hypothetical protein